MDDFDKTHLARLVEAGDAPEKLLDVVMHEPAFKERFPLMDWLKKSNPVSYYVVLGMMYEVSVYKVADSPFRDEAPQDQRNLYFAATMGSDFPDSPGIPLASSLEEAFRLSCEVLELEKLFHLECEIGDRLPRQLRLLRELKAA